MRAWVGGRGMTAAGIMTVVAVAAMTYIVGFLCLHEWDWPGCDWTTKVVTVPAGFQTKTATGFTSNGRSVTTTYQVWAPEHEEERWVCVPEPGKEETWKK